MSDVAAVAVVMPIYGERSNSIAALAMRFSATADGFWPGIGQRKRLALVGDAGEPVILV